MCNTCMPCANVSVVSANGIDLQLRPKSETTHGRTSASWPVNSHSQYSHWSEERNRKHVRGHCGRRWKISFCGLRSVPWVISCETNVEQLQLAQCVDSNKMSVSEREKERGGKKCRTKPDKAVRLNGVVVVVHSFGRADKLHAMDCFDIFYLSIDGRVQKNAVPKHNAKLKRNPCRRTACVVHATRTGRLGSDMDKTLPFACLFWRIDSFPTICAAIQHQLAGNWYSAPYVAQFTQGLCRFRFFSSFLNGREFYPLLCETRRPRKIERKTFDVFHTKNK